MQLEELGMQQEEERVAVVNPSESGREAFWHWGGTPYSLKPGEAKAMRRFMADHARKHNPFLFVGDMNTNQAEFAKIQENAAKAKVDAARQQLERAAEELRRAQASEIQAAANRKAQDEENRRQEAQAAELARAAEQQEREKLEAAKRAAGVKPKA